VVRLQVEREIVAQEEGMADDLAAEPVAIGIARAQAEQGARGGPVQQPRGDHALVPGDAVEARLRDRLGLDVAARQREERVAITCLAGLARRAGEVEAPALL